MTKKQKEQIKELKLENEDLRRIIKQIKHAVKCPYCLGIVCIKHGKRYNTNKGIVQRYECLSCHRKFSIRDESFRMRHTTTLIDKALELRKKGLSYEKISNELGNPVSRQSIYRWQNKLGEIKNGNL